MCRPASMIIVKGPKAIFSANRDSHTQIREEFGLPYNNGRNVVNVQVEILPPSDDFSATLDKWEFVVDQDTLPDWWDPKEAEAETRSALEKWAKIRLVRPGDVKSLYAGDHITAVVGGTIKYMSAGSFVDIVQGGTIDEVDKGTIYNFVGGVIDVFANGTINSMDQTATINNCGGGCITHMHRHTTIHNFNNGYIHEFSGQINRMHGGYINYAHHGYIDCVKGGLVNAAYDTRVDSITDGIVIFQSSFATAVKGRGIVISRKCKCPQIIYTGTDEVQQIKG